jgi:hypothetical protein
MANEVKKKEEIKEAQVASDSTVRELQKTVDALPRTDHMTLPAIMITEIDEETLARMASVEAINKATKPDEVIDEEGKTLQQVRNEFEFGVTNLDDEAGKHEFIVEGNARETESVTVVPPVAVVVNAEGEEEEVQGDPVVIKPTPANIAPVDAEAPHNPVEAREAVGLAVDGSEGEAPIGTPALPGGIPTNPQPEAGVTKEFGTAPKVGGDTPTNRPNLGGSGNPLGANTESGGESKS